MRMTAVVILIAVTVLPILMICFLLLLNLQHFIFFACFFYPPVVGRSWSSDSIVLLIGNQPFAFMLSAECFYFCQISGASC